MNVRLRDELSSEMKVMGIMRNPRGYQGFLKENKRYVYFRYSEKRGLKRLVEYAVDDFGSYERFVSIMSKFVPITIFFETPVEVNRIDRNTLDYILDGKRI